MAFFDTLRRVLGGGALAPSPRSTLDDTGGWLDEPGSDAGPAVPPDPPTDYDRVQWRKKLKRLLNELLDEDADPVGPRPADTPLPHAPGTSPVTGTRWGDLMLEAKALELDPDWIASTLREEFLLLVRRVVSDRIITEREHRRLDQARELVGMPDAEAEAALRKIVAEAESFFGKPVREE